MIFPGEKVVAKIKVLTPEIFENMLEEELNFEFREGAKLIGTGKILKIINEKLEKT